MRYEGIIRKKIIEVSYTLAISIALLFIIFKCNEIPTHVTDLRSEEMRDSTQFLLESHPYSIKHLFSLHDISKEEYVYLLPPHVGMRGYSFSRNYEGADWSDTGHDIAVKDENTLLVFPDGPEISFYTKLLLSENLQSLRTFFLTEIFTFFLAVFGSNSYGLFKCLYRRKHGRSFSFSKRAHLKFAAVYAISSVVLIVLIIIICKSPVREINECSYHESGKSSIFSPYDISQTYYRMIIPLDKLNRDTIVWSSDEIVEFSSMLNVPKKKSSKSLIFVKYNEEKAFTNNFYTKNLVSKNLQDIRLFLLTTILLLFMVRCYIHLKSSFSRRPLFLIE